MDRLEAIKEIQRLSCHFALTDKQKELCREIGDLLKSDVEEIKFLKGMQRQMMSHFSEAELGEMANKEMHQLPI